MDINWLQVLIAYFLGAFTWAMVRGWLSAAKSKVAPG
jgi:hypothetical protein